MEVFQDYRNTKIQTQRNDMVVFKSVTTKSVA